MRPSTMLAILIGASRLRESGAPSKAQAKQLATETNEAVNAQEARGLAIIAGLQQTVTDTTAALELAKENEVDQELIDLLTTAKNNAEDNFLTIAPEAARKAGVVKRK